MSRGRNYGRRGQGRRITTHVNDVAVSGSNPRQVAERLEDLAGEEQDPVKREQFLQHAEHFNREHAQLQESRPHVRNHAR